MRLHAKFVRNKSLTIIWKNAKHECFPNKKGGKGSEQRRKCHWFVLGDTVPCLSNLIT